jgi:hypothetical protein
MKKPRVSDPIEPMDLANMRANGVWSLDLSCWQCYHPMGDGVRSLACRLSAGGIGTSGGAAARH